MPITGSKPSISASSWFSVCFPLVVVYQRALAGPPLPDRVYLVDEDDGRGALTGLGEQVTYPGRADPDEHLHEARP
jgi:hypothetical protein